MDITSLEIIKQSTDKNRNIILEVVSKNKHSTCHKYGKPATKRNGLAPTRLIRHLSILDTPVYLQITPIRYACESCDDNTTTTEQYDWCNRNSSTTKGLDDYIMRCLINSTIEDVVKKERMGRKVIQFILDRQVQTQVDWSCIKRLGTIGIDEITIKKGHQSFVTMISSKTDDDRLKVIATISGRLKEDVKAFLESIPAELKKTVKQDKHSPILKQAHSRPLRLTHIFNTHSNRKSATAKTNRWITATIKSGIMIFDSFINTLQKYKPYIVNYFKARNTSGFVEGLNNKIKVLKRRCYGLIKITTIFQRLFLDLQGYECYA